MTRLRDLVHALGPHLLAAVTPLGAEIDVTSLAIHGSASDGAAALVVVTSEMPGRALPAALAAAPIAVLTARLADLGDWCARAADAKVALLVLRDAQVPADVIDHLRRTIESLDVRVGDEPALGDLPALADAFADIVGGPTILEDSEFHVLAYSSFTGEVDRGRDEAILGRRMPQQWFEHLNRSGMLDRLRTSNVVVDFADGPARARRRLIASVHDGGQMLGLIWAAEGSTPFPDDAVDRLHKLSAVAVPHFARHEHRHREQQQRAGEVVRRLLNGDGPAERLADELSMARRSLFEVWAFTVVGEGHGSPGAWDRLTSHLALSIGSFGRPAFATRVGETVYVIVDVADAPGKLARAIGPRICQEAGAITGATVRGTAGQSAVRIAGLPEQRADADRILDYLRFRSDNGVEDPAAFTFHADVRHGLILHELVAELKHHEGWRLPGVEALRDSDRRRGTDLVATLRTLLDAQGNVAAAARRLHVHPTTLRYRLAQITAAAGVNLADPDTRLATELALRSTDRE